MRQTELRQLQRDVASDAGGDDLVEHFQVGPRRGVGLGHVGDALTEKVERLLQARGFDDASGGDRFLDGFTGNEAAGKAAGTAHAVARREGLQ